MKLQKFFIAIHSSLWFLPALAILASAALAMVLLEVDHRWAKELHQWWPRVFSSDAEGARAMLSAIASAMATITGVAFSITIVALVLASTQYTSRVLRTFMRDRATQLVLGVFVGVYIYCLLVLRSLTGNNGEFVPPLAVLGGLILAITSVGFFIFFIHHISASIQASEIAAAITRETIGVVEHCFPQRCKSEEDQNPQANIDSIEWQPLTVQAMGYIQSVDVESLSAFAREYDVILRMECGVGDFVAPHLPLISFSGPEGFRERAAGLLIEFYAINTYRTIEQDPAFGIRQLVDIALKALSPGINDTTTAATCVEHLSAILMHIVQREMPSPLHYEQGKLRVIGKRICFGRLLALSYNQVLENAQGNTEILTRILASIAQIASVTLMKNRREALHEWLKTVEEVSLRGAKSSYAVHQLKEHIAFAESVLNRNGHNKEG